MAYRTLGKHSSELSDLRRLLRDREMRDSQGLFGAEGTRAVRGLLARKVAPEAIYIEQGVGDEILSGLPLDAVREVPPGSIDRAATTNSPQAIIGVFPMSPPVQLSEAPKGAFIVALDVNNPGNAGAMLRSVEAAGLGGVVFGGVGVDPYHPKTVRSSAGAICGTTVIIEQSPKRIITELARVHAVSVVEGGISYTEASLDDNSAVWLGNEARGLPSDIVESADIRITIPMAGEVDSLNVAMAATLFAYEVARRGAG